MNEIENKQNTKNIFLYGRVGFWWQILPVFCSIRILWCSTHFFCSIWILERCPFLGTMPSLAKIFQLHVAMSHKALSFVLSIVLSINLLIPAAIFTTNKGFVLSVILNPALGSVHLRNWHLKSIDVPNKHPTSSRFLVFQILNLHI